MISKYQYTCTVSKHLWSCILFISYRYISWNHFDLWGKMFMSSHFFRMLILFCFIINVIKGNKIFFWNIKNWYTFHCIELKFFEIAQVDNNVEDVKLIDLSVIHLTTNLQGFWTICGVLPSLLWQCKSGHRNKCFEKSTRVLCSMPRYTLIIV